VRRALAFAALACLAAGAAAAQTPAEVDYALQCRGCHGPDGAGVAGHVPSLAGVGTLLATPAGRARLLAVPGVRQASLSDERLAALLAWAAVRFAPPGEAPAFAPLSAAEVARLRATEPGN
jgi:cytochrome c553